ncbi:MAG: glycerol-3-phosphate 1-O-acyltransferase PlsY [Bacteroidota bacterium]
MSFVAYILFFVVISYILGSIPSAVWIGKTFHNMDVREHGSKNAGATNTFRVLGKKAGILVLLMDVLKGVIAVLLPKLLLKDLEQEQLIQIQLINGIAVFLGHLFPLFAQFRGGKGVATSLGIIVGIHPPAAGVCFLIFLLVFISSKYVSLGAIVASFFFPLIVFFLFKETSLYLIIFSIVIGFTVILTHKKNIIRLLHGEENKMNLFKR